MKMLLKPLDEPDDEAIEQGFNEDLREAGGEVLFQLLIIAAWKYRLNKDDIKHGFLTIMS
jgi:NTP pyrophosphatase (non-canonical NTP hydrolase)